MPAAKSFCWRCHGNREAIEGSDVMTLPAKCLDRQGCERDAGAAGYRVEDQLPAEPGKISTYRENTR
jgi:hypothetical protein